MHRITWPEVPMQVRAAIERELGDTVTKADSARGGFSPCLAAKLELSDRGPVFVKAVSGDQNPDSPSFVRREIENMARLPSQVPSPRLLAAFDDGDWVVAIFEHIDGRLPADPWTETELDLAFAALADLNAVAAPADFATAGEFLAPLFNGWQKLAARAAMPDTWADRTDELIDLERRALDAMQGDRLVHNDVRSDNMLVTPRSTVVFVDWAHACRGAEWLDPVLWACALELEGGGPPGRTIARLRPDARPSDDALLAVVAAVAGYFAHQGQLPDPPGLPTVRAFQRAQGEIADRWLAQLLEAQ